MGGLSYARSSNTNFQKLSSVYSQHSRKNGYTISDIIKFKAIYYKDNHKITAGIENTVYDIFNVFIVAQDGQWTFIGEDNFENGIASEFTANNAKTGNYQDAAAIFEYENEEAYQEALQEKEQETQPNWDRFYL